MNRTQSKFDVVVCGGGPAGVAAALAAARRGARTLLIERYGFCGGMATAALVNPWAGHEYRNPETGERGSLIGGIFEEVVRELVQRGGFGSDLSPSAFDEELLKSVYDVALLAAGVTVRYHSYLLDVVKEDDRITAIEVLSKGGRERFEAAFFIDASGDADLTARAGCGFSTGRSEDGLTQAMTVSFRMANVDKRAMIATGNLRKARALVEPYFQQAIASGELYYPYRNFVHFYDYPRPGVLHFNMTRINRVSGLNAEDLSRAEMEGRRQAYLIGDWLTKAVPYFKEAYIEKVACQVGVRETRHIHGLYTMTMDDIVQARKFSDGITRSCYFIDIHNPTGAQDQHQKTAGRGAVKAGFAPPPGDFYEVPFRSLITPDCPNLIVACRALAATHEASAAVRVMATMHGVGEAAGVAAAECVRKGEDVTKISGEWVRSQIPYLHHGPDHDLLWKSKGGVFDHTPMGMVTNEMADRPS
ncbi:MAG TPA: FAD-dependent oxidoreductase [Opitutaceae bacterium]|nr:FAD-dependent oxidoreductase [Opitutaceae bacterium]